MRTAIRNPWLWIAVSIVALTAWTLWALNQQSLQFEQDSYNRCKDRVINTDKVNAFYQKMAAIERVNPYVNTKIRAQRVAAYEAVQLAPPHCGLKP